MILFEKRTGKTNYCILLAGIGEQNQFVRHIFFCFVIYKVFQVFKMWIQAFGLSCKCTVFNFCLEITLITPWIHYDRSFFRSSSSAEYKRWYTILFQTLFDWTHLREIWFLKNDYLALSLMEIVFFYFTPFGVRFSDSIASVFRRQQTPNMYAEA